MCLLPDRAAVAALICVCVLASATVAELPEPRTFCVGIITEVAGEVTVNGVTGRERVEVGHVLAVGDTIVAMSGGSCSGFAPSGEVFSLEGPSQMRLGTAEDDSAFHRVSMWIRTQVSQWIGVGQRKALVTRAAGQRWDVRLSAPNQLVPVPNGRVRCSDARLRWVGIRDADEYVISIVSGDDDPIELHVRGLATTLEELEPGLEYVWEVRPLESKSPERSRWRAFSVMSVDEERSLDSALAGLDDIKAGVLLLSVGLHEEAIARLDVAVTVGESVQSARVWRARALAEVGLHEAAYRDIVQARGCE